MDVMESLQHFAPEGLLSVMIILVLLASLFRRGRNNAFFFIAGGMGILAALGLELVLRPGQEGPVLLFRGMLQMDSLAHLFNIIFLLSSLVLLAFSFFSRETAANMRNSAEYVILVLSATLGMMLMGSSANLVMLYLSLELLSFSSYLLTGFVDRDEKTAEAAVKYLLYGGVASGVMVYGLSLLYGIAGTLDYPALREFFAHASPDEPLLTIAFIFILTGMGFKIAAYPFHAWCPDVYEGASAPLAAFLSVGSKAAGFVIILRFFYQIFTATESGGTLAATGGADWPTMLAVLSALTMTYGNLAALHQRNMKRLLAYSSIAHAGYVLMAVASVTILGVSSVFLYTAIYFLMNFGAFLVVIVIANDLQSERLEDYEGLAWKGRSGALLASLFAVYLFSLTGVPPFAGFIGKVYLLLSVFTQGSALYWLAVVAVVNTVISFVYYANVLRVMFLSDRTKGAVPAPPRGRAGAQYAVLIVLAGLTILFGVYWAPLQAMAERAAAFLN